MSEFLGARISLISRSDIRYVGTLHEINSEESTVSLQSVKSFGTEGRKGNPEEEIPPSNELYDYIIFRGSDVKDLRIEQGPGAVKENKPPPVPNDPAIVGASRARPGNVAPGPPGPPGPPGNVGGPPPGPYGQNAYYPPQQAPWGRGGGPPPGANPFGGMPYPPPPGWFPPGGAQGFPLGPPGQWSNYPPPPPGPQMGPNQAEQGSRQGPKAQDPSTAPSGTPSAENQRGQPGTDAPRQVELPAEPKSLSQAPSQAAPSTGPPPPVASKPSAEEVKATAASLNANGPPGAAEPGRFVPTGPKVTTTRITQITPAVPLPAALTAKVTQPNPTAASKGPSDMPPSTAATSAALRDATQAAKAAVAVAMAKLDASASTGAAPGTQPNGGNNMDNLTRRVNEMRVNATRGTGGGGRSSNRGRGPRPAKVEVPESDFDFASSNAKFNKDEVLKEAIAGSPLGDASNGSTPDAAATGASPATETAPPAYNKSRSFFDNISSESKERAENGGQKPGGREWRGEEQRKNMETFGQGSVDGGHRNYRGRGRGRGGGGGGGNRRGGYNSGRGGGARGGFRSNDSQQPVSQ